MITEFGHLALCLALAVALIQATLPLYGAYARDGRLVALAVPSALVQATLVGISFACLTTAFVRSDFSVLAVFQNSHTLKPMIYKISGVWANHEGSLLLWVLILSLAGASVAVFSKALPADFRARALAAQAMIGVGFYVFLLFTSNPFARLLPTPAEGRGLNPILQDPGLAFHPPMLYAGYVGLSVAFSFAVAALIEGRIGPLWARWVRPWTLAAWSALTCGIALGSWWAYYELGWGGYWFWDPVENASLMPWLAATALLHSAIVLEKRDALKSWTVLLAIVAFSLSLMGTFIVRSGVLTSVHAFAVDPKRGIFILSFLVLAIGGSLTLYGWRASKLENSGAFATVSREGFLVANNLVLMALLSTVFLGTLYPLALDSFSGKQISVGAPYYMATFVPLSALLIFLAAVGPLLSWRQDEFIRTKQRLLIVAAITAGGTLMVLILRGIPSGLAALGFIMTFWLVGGVVADFAHRLRYGDGGPVATLERVARLPRSVYAMVLGHLGVAITVFGITASGAWQSEVLTVTRVGQTLRVGPYDFRLSDLQPIGIKNFTAIDATVDVSEHGMPVYTLHPQTRTYTDPPSETTEAGIHSRWNGDLYAVIGKPDGHGRWQVRFHWKPFVTMIWLGALVMALGGIVAISDRFSRTLGVRRVAIILQPAE